MTNPFLPGKAESFGVSYENRKVRLSPVLFGVAAVIGAAVGVMIAFLVMHPDLAEEMSEVAFMARAGWRVQRVAMFVVPGMAGGLVAGRLGSPRWLLHSLLTSAPFLAGIVAQPLIATYEPETYGIIGRCLLVPSVLIGGYLGRR